MKNAIVPLLALLTIGAPLFGEVIDLQPYWDSSLVLRNPDKGWYHHYYDNGIDNEPPVLIYTINGDGWRQEQEWPLARQQVQTLYLDEGGKLAHEPANSGWDDYRVVLDHDRRFGSNQSSRWTAIFGNLFPRGEPDMTEQDKNSLVYDTALLSLDTEVTGHPIVRLWVSSTASDGDFYAYLEDVDENGRSLMVTEGQLRSGWSDLQDPNDITDTGIVDIWQDGQDIMVKKHVDTKRCDIPDEIEGVGGYEESVGGIEA